MGNSRKKPPVVKKNPNIYQTASELPDDKKEKYSSIVEDFDKETSARVEEIEAQVNVMKTNIKQVLRRTLLQMPRNVRQLKAEDFYYEPKQEIVPMMNQKIELNTEFAKVAESVNDLVLKDFSKLNIKPKMSSKTKAKQNKRKKSSILLAEGPTGYGTAIKNLSRKKSTVITPKFDPKTPLKRSAMRHRKITETFLVSLNGSPVQIMADQTQNENVIPIPLANGSNILVPVNHPDVQPHVEALIKSCLKKSTVSKISNKY